MIPLLTLLTLFLTVPCHAVEPKWIGLINTDAIIGDGKVWEKSFVRTSTSPIVALEGETVWQVYPATATVCDIAGKHIWLELWSLPVPLLHQISDWRNKQDRRYCVNCLSERKRVKVKKEVEEWEE